MASIENRIISAKLNRYTQSIKAEHPLYFYIISPIKYLYRTVIASSTDRMLGSYNTTSKKLIPFRVLLDIIFWGLQMVFLFAMVIILRKHLYNYKLLLISSTTIYFYFIHTIVFKSSDFRYLVAILPLMVLIALPTCFQYFGTHSSSAKNLDWLSLT